MKRYFTGEPCKRGHVAERTVAQGQCVECGLELNRKRRAADPEKQREQGRNRYAADPEKYKERERKARAADPDKYRERNRKARAADPEKYLGYTRNSRAKHNTKPLGQLRKMCDHAARSVGLGKLGKSKLKLLGYGPAEYIAHLESTLPNGMTVAEAREAGYHVDHIVPLTVISKACPTHKAGRQLAFRMAQDLENLQMIPGVENLNKNASFNTPTQRKLFDVLSARYLTEMAA